MQLNLILRDKPYLGLHLFDNKNLTHFCINKHVLHDRIQLDVVKC